MYIFYVLVLIFCHIPQYAIIFILFTSTENEMKRRLKFVMNRLQKEAIYKDEEFVQLTGMA